MKHDDIKGSRKRDIKHVTTAEKVAAEVKTNRIAVGAALLDLAKTYDCKTGAEAILTAARNYASACRNQEWLDRYESRKSKR